MSHRNAAVGQTPAASRTLTRRLHAALRDLSDRAHAAGDTDARAIGWTSTRTTGWLGVTGRTYRDPRFGTSGTR